MGFSSCMRRFLWVTVKALDGPRKGCVRDAARFSCSGGIQYRFASRVAGASSLREMYKQVCGKGQMHSRKRIAARKTVPKPPLFMRTLTDYFAADTLKTSNHGKLLLGALDKISLALTLNGLSAMEKDQLTAVYANEIGRPNRVVFDLVASMLAKWMIIYSYRPEILSASAKKSAAVVYDVLFSLYLKAIQERVQQTSVSTLGRFALLLLLNGERLTDEARDSFVETLTGLMQEKTSQPHEDFFLDIGVISPHPSDTLEANAQFLLLVCSSNTLAAKHARTAARILDIMLQTMRTESESSQMSSTVLLTAVATYARVYRFDTPRLELLRENVDVVKSLSARLDISRLEANENLTFIENLLYIPFLFRSLSCIIGNRQLGFLNCEREKILTGLHDALEYLPYLNDMGLQQLLKTGWFPDETFNAQFFARIAMQIQRFNGETFTHFLLCSLRLRASELPKAQLRNFTKRLSELQSEIAPVHRVDVLLALIKLDGISGETYRYFMSAIEETGSLALHKVFIETIVQVLLCIEPRTKRKENKKFINFLITELANRQEKFQTWLNSKFGERSKAKLRQVLTASNLPEATQLLDSFKATQQK